MSKIFTVRIEVPSGSRPEPYKAWLNKQLAPHRMTVLHVEDYPSCGLSDEQKRRLRDKLA